MGWGRRLVQEIRNFMLGAAISWAAVPYLLRRREVLKQVFVLDLWLTLRGLGPLPGPKRLMLLPYLVPQILAWRRLWRLWDDSLETVNLAHIGH